MERDSERHRILPVGHWRRENMIRRLNFEIDFRGRVEVEPPADSVARVSGGRFAPI